MAKTAKVSLGQALKTVRAWASKFPEAERAFLFGDHEVFRIRKKVFVWLGEAESGGLYISLKLKESQAAALALPFVQPAAYGMAKWGWVACELPQGVFPEKILHAWLDESFRGTAPKTVLKALDAAKA